jgi:hypothetical protein
MYWNWLIWRRHCYLGQGTPTFQTCCWWRNLLLQILQFQWVHVNESKCPSLLLFNESRLQLFLLWWLWQLPKDASSSTRRNIFVRRLWMWWLHLLTTHPRLSPLHARRSFHGSKASLIAIFKLAFAHNLVPVQNNMCRRCLQKALTSSTSSKST